MNSNFIHLKSTLITHTGYLKKMSVAITEKLSTYVDVGNRSGILKYEKHGIV